jgi:hypothetical protein
MKVLTIIFGLLVFSSAMKVSAAKPLRGEHATFNWYSCQTRVPPKLVYVGRGKTREQALVNLVNRCLDNNQVEDEVCERRLTDMAYQCRFAPGWDL